MNEAAAPIERVRAGSAASTVRRWFDEAGFEDPRPHSLPGPFPFTLITAGRR